MLAIVLHEYAHGWVADRFGDSTARLQGRLTTNPLAHIDPFGTILFPLICLLLPGGFFLAWAKPVPVNPAQLRHPRRDMAIVAAAGTGMNLHLGDRQRHRLCAAHADRSRISCCRRVIRHGRSARCSRHVRRAVGRDGALFHFD